MKKKIIYCILAIYILQFVSACCSGPYTYEVAFLNSSTQTFESKENELLPLDASRTINKLDFVLVTSLQEELKQIASISNKINAFGFQQSYATTCPKNKYIYLEGISAISIHQIDASNNKIDVSQNFKYRTYDNEFIPISEFIAQRASWEDIFEFYLKSELNIESVARFEVTITSSINNFFTSVTNEIQFN